MTRMMRTITVTGAATTSFPVTIYNLEQSVTCGVGDACADAVHACSAVVHVMPYGLVGAQPAYAGFVKRCVTRLQRLPWNTVLR